MLAFEEIEEILKKIWLGEITEFDLSNKLYSHNAELMFNKIKQGYGFTFDELKINSPEYLVLKDLHENTYKFMAAKTFQNTRDLQAKAFNDFGFRRSFNQFKEVALPVYDLYNKTWLDAELITANAKSDSIAQWQNIIKEKDTFPLIRFQTVNDARVREDHREFDGLTRPVNDPIWNVATPPLGWRCRCILQQGDESDFRESSDKMVADLPEIAPAFRFNPATEKKIFKETGADMHPYFKVPRRYEDLKNNNFNLDIPRVS